MLSAATKARLIKLSAAMFQQAVLGGGAPADAAQLQALMQKVRGSKPEMPPAREQEPKVLSVPQ
jgi:hypothetical protein